MSKEKQIEEIANVIYDDPNCYDTYWRSHCERLAETIYNAGYRKQSEGEWIDEPHFAQRGLKGKYYVCSKCNVCVPTIVELPLNMWHYCPNCGAKMRGDTE